MLKLIRGLINLPNNFPGCVATIGNFDGVHRGHQALITQLLQKSRDFALPSLLILFEPQPYEFFSHNAAIPARLMRLREKLSALNILGLDYVLCLRFNQALADLPAEDFVKKILVDGVKASYVLVGDDFRFGHKRTGNVDLLKQAGQRWGFAAGSMDTFLLFDQRVSSSRVRKALEVGDLDAAQEFLGRRYGISGYVAHGHKRGRMIGFPTANIFLHRKAVPVSGVYAVLVHGLSEQPLTGVANVGNRPTVDGSRSLLEVHLFDFNRDIYGMHIYTEFVKKLRDEKRYDSFELLRQQILLDAENAKMFFSR